MGRFCLLNVPKRVWELQGFSKLLIPVMVSREHGLVAVVVAHASRNVMVFLRARRQGLGRRNAPG